MDFEQIQTLIERYFAGETSLAEDATLRDYFRREDVDERLLAYRPYFQYLAAESRRTAPARLLEDWQPPQSQGNIRRLPSQRWWIGVAALLVLALGLWWLAPAPLPTDADPATAAVDWSRYEIEDPEEALRITRAALVKTSRALNDGARQAMEEVERVKELNDPLN